MNAILPFIRLTRIVNVMILVLVEALLFFGYFIYYANEYDITPALSKSEVFIFLGISGLLAIGGNIINDIKDVDIDQINKPDKRIVDKVISTKAAWALYHTVNISALLLTAYWVMSTQAYIIGAILVLTGVGLYFYSSWMKRKFVIGNLCIAIFCALPPILILFLESNTLAAISEVKPEVGMWIVSVVGIYSYFAFSTTMYREIVKDIQDIPGDKAVGCTTLPVLVGGFMAKRIAMVAAMMIAFTLIAWLIYQFHLGSMLNTIAIIVGLILPHIISMIRLHRARSVQDFKSVSKAIKLVMFNGIIYLMIVKTMIPEL